MGRNHGRLPKRLSWSPRQGRERREVCEVERVRRVADRGGGRVCLGSSSWQWAVERNAVYSPAEATVLVGASRLTKECLALLLGASFLVGRPRPDSCNLGRCV